jgi:hypothetical protein
MGYSESIHLYQLVNETRLKAVNYLSTSGQAETNKPSLWLSVGIYFAHEGTKAGLLALF